MRAAVAGLLVAMAAAAGCGAPAPLPRFPTADTLAANPRAIGVPYGRWVAVRAAGHRAALELVATSSFGDRLAWRWEWTGEPPPGAPPGGAGTSVEQYGSGELEIAGRRLEWSRGSSSFAWLYWPDDAFEVYSRPFASADAARRPIDGRWLRRGDLDD